MRRAVAVVVPLMLIGALVAAPSLVGALTNPAVLDDATSETGEPYAADALNFRAAPSLDSTIKAVIPAGTVLALAGAGRNGFVPVVNNGESGWVYAAYLAPTGVTVVADVAVATATDDLNLRDGPSPTSAVTAVIPAGAVVVVTGAAQDGFLPVALDGVPGFAFAEYLDVK
jgi:uncharacterized protein YraI